MAKPLTFVQRGFAALMCAVVLAGCAVPDPSRGEVGRYKLALPDASRWTEIPAGDVFQAPLAVSGEPGALPLRTRAWGLPGTDGGWQAVVLLPTQRGPILLSLVRPRDFLAALQSA